MHRGFFKLIWIFKLYNSLVLFLIVYWLFFFGIQVNNSFFYLLEGVIMAIAESRYLPFVTG